MSALRCLLQAAARRCIPDVYPDHPLTFSLPAGAIHPLPPSFPPVFRINRSKVQIPSHQAKQSEAAEANVAPDMAAHVSDMLPWHGAERDGMGRGRSKGLWELSDWSQGGSINDFGGDLTFNPTVLVA